ncbi:MAG: 23S rRNA (adenine(2503)-C(2))-methyltransferase RlmN [Patescibacteria group bacterium]|nr:23S rRNA (adenine(2503)-C(2))-methyltransferase RlmN [Patescibacteria group bacterium]
MDFDKLYKILKDQPKYRVSQAKAVIFDQLADNWEQASTLPKELKNQLNQACPLEIKGETKISSDGQSIKALLILADDQKIETVLLSHKDGRYTVCLSSQIGCPLGCSFCATGKMGLVRNLQYGEIIDQALFFARYLAKDKQRISNIVFMGMGEPFLNYDNVIKAIKYLNEDFKIGARRISISTSGVIHGIKKLATYDKQINLAISLHAPNDKLRTQLMPINKRFPLKDLLAEVDKYIAKTDRQVMFEYLMIRGVNDQPQHAQELAKLMKKPLYLLNLIAYNPTEVFKASRSSEIRKFKSILEREGVLVTQRYSFGKDIEAACGQLVVKREK